MSLIYSGPTGGGLADGSTYNVIVVDDDTLLLGTEFEGAQVDPVANTITFGRTIEGDFVPFYHNLVDGQVVVYYANGANVPGLVNGRQYRVEVVDDSTILLYEVTSSTVPIPIKVGNVDDVDDEAVDTIKVNNNFVNGQIVIYLAPTPAAEFSSALVDIEADGDGLPLTVEDVTGFTPEDNDVIIIQDHHLTTGQEVYYDSGLGAPIGGLASGERYWVIRLDDNRIRLADSYCHAMGGTECIDHYEGPGAGTDEDGNSICADPILGCVTVYVPREYLLLTPDTTPEAAEVVHKLFKADARPIDGLVDGEQYYVVNQGPGSFQLSHTLGGPVIDLGIEDRGAGDEAGSFLAGPVDLGAGTGIGRIVIDLTAGASGTQLLKPISQFGTVPNGARMSSTTVRSAGGGFVNVQRAETTTFVDADIAVTIGGGAKVTSGGDFTLTTDALGMGSSDSTNGGGGFIAIGASQSSSTVNIDTVITVGAGAVVESKWNLQIESTTRGDVRAYSSAKAGGLGSGVDARSKASLTAKTTIDIDGSLIAEHLLGIRGYVQPNGDVSASADASGLGADSSGNDCGGNCGLYVTASVDIDVAGATTVLRGDELDIVATMGTTPGGNGGRLTSYAYSRARALGADSDATSTVQVRGGATITVHAGVVLTAWERMRLAALSTGLFASSVSNASCGCLGGDTDSTANIDYVTTSKVLTEPTVLVETAHLYVDTVQNNPGWTRETHQSKGLFDGGSKSGGITNTGNRPIVWEADVILHDDNPQLYIAADGTILKKYGVEVSDGNGTYYGVGDRVPDDVTIHVDQIDNDGGTTADFTINVNGAGGDRTLTGTRGSFQIRSTFDFVRIYNWSDRDLVLSGIDVVNLEDLAATVSLRAYNEAEVFRYTIRPPVFTETRVEVVNYLLGGADNSITLTGTIYNPIGTVVVDNRNGDVLSEIGVVAIIANVVELTASNGSIGTLGDGTTGRVPVVVQLIESAYGTAPDPITKREVSIVLDAKTDVVVDLTVIRRSGETTPLVWTIQQIHAGKHIDLVIGDTLVGTEPAPFQGHEIQNDVYDAPGANYGGLVSPPTGLYSVFFYFDQTFSYGDVLLIAFGDDTTPEDSAYVFQDVSAGEVIGIRHESATTTIDFDVHTDIDAALVSKQDPSIVYSTSNGSGRIDLFTNGEIVSVEVHGDLLVGTIESTDSDVTLTAQDTGASILDAVDDGDARVIGTVVTLTANGTIGRVEPAVNVLEIRSSNAARGKLVASAPGGVFIAQVTGDLVLGSVVASAGDVALAALAGSILNDVDDGTTRVTGHDIDLTAPGGRIGTATGTADVVVDTADDGRLLADGRDGVFVTEATGSLNLLLARSSDGAVRITVPFVAGGPDEDLTLLATGESVDGLVQILVGGAMAKDEVELRMGNDFSAPIGTLIEGSNVIVRTAYGQDPAAPVATTAYFGGTVTGTDPDATIEVFGGNGDDTVTFFETFLDGQTTVYGGATAASVSSDGDDLVVITRITILPGTHLGTAADDFLGLPIQNSLRVDGQNGSNHVEVTAWGIDDPDAHETRIEVVGTGTDPFAINTLTVNAADGDDVVLLRAVTYIPGLPASRPAFVAVASGESTVERISYDRSVNGKLTVNGLDGNDLFVFDDTSSPSTVNGGDGDDTFIVGQFFDTERTGQFLQDEDAFPTALTELGWLSPGISRPAALYGGAGDDRFLVNSNRSELRMEAGTGDDEFVFVTSVPVGVFAPASGYVEQGFVSLDGGTGHSTVEIQAADTSAIVFDPLWWTVVGGGLSLDLYGFTAAPSIVAVDPPSTPIGLPGEDGVVLLLSAFAVNIAPPYVFDGRGGKDAIVIVETGGWTNVHPDGPLMDSYTIKLAKAPTADVYITITSAYGGGLPFAQFSLDGGTTWVSRAVLRILAGDTSEHQILVRWADPSRPLSDLPPGSTVVTLSHTVSSADPEFDGIDVRNVYVNLFKDARLEPAGPTDPHLAGTGASPGPASGLGWLLLLAGLALVLVGRRRREQPHPSSSRA